MISLFPKASDIKNGKDIPFDIFLDNIKEGAWQDMVLPIRAIADKAKRDEAKKRVPYVTISGKFRERTDAGLITHSGFIGIDIDDVDPEEVKSIICPDHYIYAAFTSIGGRGVCAVFKINGDKHRDAFAAIGEYLMDKYQLVIDPTSVNPSRARFISYDPHIYVNVNADKFTAISKRKPDKKVPEVIYVQTDFDLIIQEIVSRRIDITGDYHTWLRIGFALADKFGEGGRNYFHQVSQIAADYNPRVTDKQFTNCLKARKSGITIASFYYLAKQAGITTVSPQTKLISQAAFYAKKGARTKESAVVYLKDAEGIPEDISQPIVEQVFASNITVKDEDTLIEQVRNWLKVEYEDCKINEVTKKVEINGKEMDDDLFDKVFIKCKIIFDKINAELFHRILRSSTRTYNPFFEFFDNHKYLQPKGVIKDFFSCIKSDTGFGDGEFFPEYVYYFGLRWLVGVIASIHGIHSVLMLVLTGSQGTKKSKFFRELLPDELRAYYTESKMDRGRDDDILMCKKLIIMDDEMGGKSKKDEKRMKGLLSKDFLTVRAPYGKFDVDMRRIAVFCGTTNEQDILNDPTGNRRIIPIHVLSIDFEKYSKIDKTALLMEAYWLWKSGFDWFLTQKDIEILKDNTGAFEEPSAEYDLLVQHFEVASEDQKKSEAVTFLTTTEIKSILEMRTHQKLSITKLGIELRKMRVPKVSKKIGYQVVKGYFLIERWKKGTDQSTLYGRQVDT
jgi:predicted P-loop ATPase